MLELFKYFQYFEKKKEKLYICCPKDWYIHIGLVRDDFFGLFYYQNLPTQIERVLSSVCCHRVVAQINYLMFQKIQMLNENYCCIKKIPIEQFNVIHI